MTRTGKAALGASLLAVLAAPLLAQPAAPAEPGAAEAIARRRASAAALSAATPSGGRIDLPAVRYEVLSSGPPTGSHPTRDSAVKVRYEGSFTDGTIFTSTHGRGDGTEIFRLGGRIPGFVTILQAMRPGDRWRAFIPAAFAYPAGPAAVAGKDLIFEIELIDFAQLPPQAGSPLMSALPKKN